MTASMMYANMDSEHYSLEGRGSHRRTLFWHRLLVSLLTAFFAAMPSAFSQAGYDTATLKGTIYDEQGATVASATITIQNVATALSKTQQATTEGTFQLPALPPGSYRITVEAPGFSKAVAENVLLTVGATVIYDVHLTVGQVRSVVEVTDRPPLIDTAQTQQANTIDTRQVVNLPNINLNFTQAIYTLPGVASSSAPAVQDPNIGTAYSASGFSIGG